MKTTERFEKAVSKLYTAFHKGELDAMDCSACAVGNIVGHSDWDGWAFNRIGARFIGLEEPKVFSFRYPTDSDYTSEELKIIEYVFLKEWDNAKSANGKDKEIQFKGLCAVVEYLCELDNIPNVMDYSSLFEYDKETNKAAKQLSNVL